MATIKKGTYRFNDVLSAPSNSIHETINFTVTHTNASGEKTINFAYLGVNTSDGIVVNSIVYSGAGVEVLAYSDLWDNRWNSVYGDGTKIITVLEDTEVDDEFAKWFMANTMTTIKVGKYRFNDVLTAPPVDYGKGFQIQFEINVTFQGNNYTAFCDAVSLEHFVDSPFYFEFAVYKVSDIGDYNDQIIVYNSEVGWKTDLYGEGIKTITIPNDTDVTPEFYEWFTANAKGQISGVWKFKDYISIPDYNIIQDVNFSCSFDAPEVGISNCVLSCNGIYLYCVDHAYKIEVLYDVVSSVPDISGLLGVSFPYALQVYKEFWGADGYKWVIPAQTIDFGTEPQYVSVDFYNWLTENTKPIVEDIDYLIKSSTLLSIANSIRQKTGKTNKITPKDMSSEILSISGGANNVPFTIIKNGTYDKAYAVSEITWGADSEYDISISIDDSSLRFKKVNFSIPDPISYLASSSDYIAILNRPDGSKDEVLLKDVDLIPIADNGVLYGYTDDGLNILLVKIASIFNEELGVDFFENDSVYITDALWAFDEYLTDYTITIRAPGERTDGFSKVIVNVQPDPVPQSYVVQNIADLPLGATNGSFAFILGGE